MSGLPTWAIGSIVAASAVLGPLVAFLVALAVALLIRRLTGVSKPPAMVLAAVEEIGGSSDVLAKHRTRSLGQDEFWS
jgi:phosphate/sulfate permease